jgi:hypothetical protein
MTYVFLALAFSSKFNMNLLQVVQNKALGVIGNTRTEKLLFDNDIHMLKRFMKRLASKLYAYNRNSRNKYIKKLG